MRVDTAEAVEALERFGMPAGRDARAGIVDGEQDGLAAQRAADFDAAAGRREADRVDEQVVHQQVQAELDGQQLVHLEARLQRDVALGCRRTEFGHHVPVDLFEVHGAQRMAAGHRQAVDAGEVEQPVQQVAGLVDARHQAAQGSRQLVRRSGQRGGQLGLRAQAGQRRAHLVRGNGRELALDGQAPA